jgi:TolA-binding protein
MSAKSIVPTLFVGTMFAFSTTIFAQAPVEDRSVPAVNRSATAQSAQSSPSQDANVQLYMELQTLRQEVSDLRGMIEELNYHIDQLGTRQGNDYANLDRRLLELSGGNPGGVAVSPNSAGANTSTIAPPVIASGPTANSKAGELYNQAFTSLRSGDRDVALSRFEQVVKEYPNDAVTGDALYWMGETHWVAAAYEKSRQAFVMLTERFPDHRRYGDALYKLGLIYHQLGDDASARKNLQKAVALGGDVGARAEEFLSKNMTP